MKRISFVLFFVVLLFSATYSFAGKAKPMSLVPTLDREYPDLYDKKTVEKVYECVRFPDPQFVFTKMNVDEWIAQLKPMDPRKDVDCSTHIWFVRNGAKYISTVNTGVSTYDFYMIGKNNIEKVIGFKSGKEFFITEVGVYKWEYLFDQNKLYRVNYYQIINPDDKKQKGPRFYQIDIVKYWENSAVPKQILTYENENELKNEKPVHILNLGKDGQPMKKDETE